MWVDANERRRDTGEPKFQQPLLKIEDKVNVTEPIFNLNENEVVVYWECASLQVGLRFKKPTPNDQ